MYTGKWIGLCGLMTMLALCLSNPLYATETATSWRIGTYQVVCPDIPTDSVDWILRLAEDRFTVKDRVTEREAEYLRALLARAAVGAAQDEAHGYWTGENLSEIARIPQLLEPAPVTGSFSEGLPVEYIPLQTSPAYDSLFVHANPQFMATLGIRENLAGVLVVWPVLVENLLRLKVVYHDLATNGYEVLFDRLTPLRDVRELQDELLLALLPLGSGTEVSLLHIENPVPGLTARIDGKDRPIVGNQVVTPAGEIILELSAFGYEPVSVPLSVAPGEKAVVDGNLKPATFGPLSISSSTGTVDWFLDGVRQNGLPFMFPNQTLPLNIVASRKGFMSSAVQSTTAMRTIVFDLKPEWMTDENLITRNRDSFYTAMGRAFGAFGLWVGLQSLATTFSDYGTGDPLWQPWIFLSAGVSVVSVVDLIGDLLAYYTGTRYSTP